MRTKIKFTLLFLPFALRFCWRNQAFNLSTLDLDGASTHIKIQPTMYGIFSKTSISRLMEVYMQNLLKIEVLSLMNL
jgi:hypothetical protein